MLDRAIDAVGEVADDVVVVAATGSVPATSPDVRLVRRLAAFEGPLAGLAIGLAASIRRRRAGHRRRRRHADARARRAAPTGRHARQHEAAVLADATVHRPLPVALRRSAAAPAVERLLAAVSGASARCSTARTSWSSRRRLAAGRP